MKAAYPFLLVFILAWVSGESAMAQRPSSGLLMPYTNHWHARDYGTVDLLSLLRCDVARWKDHSTSTSPLTLGGFAMTYDNQRQRVVFFFGVDDHGLRLVSETWEWDGATWTQKSTVGPPGRVNQAMVYDASSQVVLLYGGQGADLQGTFTQILGDTWVWNGTEWTELHPVHHPSPRAGHSVVFDAARGEVVLFGGDETDSLDMQGPYLNDTWVWDGTDWDLKDLQDAPPVRFRHAMTYDVKRQRVVLFGGNDEDGPLNDTWEWDGNHWNQVTTAHTPDSRRGHGMTYDSRREKVVLFGGELGSDFSSETWEYDGMDWTRIEAANPPETDALALTYDSTRGETVLFTGEQPDATFVYDGEPSCPE